MRTRRLYLDQGVGETRAVVTLDGLPERLLIERAGAEEARLGARLIARVTQAHAAAGIAFLEGPEAAPLALNFERGTTPPVQGAAVEVEVRAEARRGKSALVRLIGPAEGAARVLDPGPDLAARLAAFAPEAEIIAGGIARAVADGAEEAVLAPSHPLPGGGALTIEPTRALTAVDVDLGEGASADGKRAARAANLAAIGHAARLLRLKGFGGLIAIDFIGRGQDAPALLAAAKGAFAPDNPGVAFAAVSRFGVLELTVPRRQTPAWEMLTDEGGERSALSLALALVRAVEREAAADGGARLEAFAAPDVAAVATPAMAELAARIGGRARLTAEEGRAREAFEVVRR